jgi:antitoxin YefM
MLDVQQYVHYTVHMNAVNYTDLRRNLKARMDEVCHDHEPLIVTRKNSENVVLISLDDYNSLTETQYLLSSKNNAEHLMKSLESSRNGNSFAKELIEE